MLNRRLIPKLMLKEMPFGTSRKKILVTTKQFSQAFPIGDPVSQAKVYESQLADELILLDLDSKIETDPSLIQTLHRMTEQIFLPLTVGGGVRTIDGMRMLLKNGADKVSLNTIALENSDFISQAAEAFGSQAVVIHIDYKTLPDGKKIVFSHSGKMNTQLEVQDWVERVQHLGAGEILLNCIERDGMRQGLDVELANQVSKSIHLPLILSGGCGSAQHFIDGFEKAGVEAIAAGTYFCFKDENPMQTRSRINNAGLNIRLET